MTFYLIDTNVMLAASASHEAQSDVQGRAMPHEAGLRQHVHDWLATFDLSDDGLVLDEASLIMYEYQRNLPFSQSLHHQEYALEVLQRKRDRGLVRYVPIKVVEANGERVAELPEAVARIVTDREDRKWIAAALAARKHLGLTTPIVYAAESDWLHVEGALGQYGVVFCRLLPRDWYKTG